MVVKPILSLASRYADDVAKVIATSSDDVAKYTDAPFIASHSNADIVNNEFGRKRNLTDEQIDILKDRNGLIGLNFCKDFIEFENKKGVSALEHHLSYFLDRGCEKIIALGSDFDGCTLSSGINGLESMESIYNALINDGFSEQIVNGLFYNNANRFFKMMITQ